MKNRGVVGCSCSPPPPLRQGNYIMNYNIFTQLSQFLQKSLEFFACHSDNNATTKFQAVQPNRHSLAIFTPTVSDNSPTSVNISSLQDTDSITSYGGLIGVNTRPKGNSPSHLGMVVETCHPIFGWRKLTKFQGNPRMNKFLFTHTISNTISKFSIFTPVESLFKQLSQFLQKSLEFFTCHSDNNATTKLLTALPSRHFLAIFTPTVSDNSPTSVNIPSLQDAHSITNYGGVIGVNTRPKGNSPSRLVAVVEPCHPLSWVVTLTKLLGAFAMNAITHTISNTVQKFSIFTPVESLVLGFVLGLPIACLVIGVLAIMGV